MQKQIYQSGSILQKASKLYEKSSKLSEAQLKQLLVDMASRIDKIEKESRDAGFVQEQMHQKINNKMLQIEQRRKVWDGTMAEIFNEKQRISISLKAKLDRIDKFQKQTQQELDKLREKLSNEVANLKQNQSNGLIIAMDKIQKVRKQLSIEIQKTNNELQQQKKQEQKEQFKFTVSCQEIKQLINQERDCDKWKQQTQAKFEEIKQQKKPTSAICNNFMVIVKNLQALGSLKSQVSQLSSVIDRFQSKIVYMGERMEVIDNKVSDALQQNRESMLQNRVKSQSSKLVPRVQVKQDNSNFLLTSAKYFKQFLVEGRVITYLDSQEDCSCVLYGSQPIHKKTSFSIEIVHSSKKYISVGIVDRQYQDSKDCWSKQNFIIMRGFHGEVYCGPNNKIKQTGAQFTNGDVVKVQVNFRESIVLWQINNVPRAVYKSRKLNQNIVWVPAVRFYNNLDSIRWL